MKIWRDLVESAGLSLSPGNVFASCLSISALVGLAVFSFTTIFGLAVAISLLVLGILLELIRSLGISRQRALEQTQVASQRAGCSSPQVFLCAPSQHP